VDDFVRIELSADAPVATRTRVWRNEVPKIFEGLRVRVGASFAPATLKIALCGSSRLAMLEGGAHGVERKVAGRDASSGLLNLLLQTHGESAFAQGGRRGKLVQGDIALIDGAQSSELELGDVFANPRSAPPRLRRSPARGTPAPHRRTHVSPA
jgi:hypothetical protein